MIIVGAVLIVPFNESQASRCLPLLLAIKARLFSAMRRRDAKFNSLKKEETSIIF